MWRAAAAVSQLPAGHGRAATCRGVLLRRRHAQHTPSTRLRHRAVITPRAPPATRWRRCSADIVTTGGAKGIVAGACGTAGRWSARPPRQGRRI